MVVRVIVVVGTENAFHQDLLAVDFKSLISTDVNESVTTIVDNLSAITDRHTPCAKHQNGNNESV